MPKITVIFIDCVQDSQKYGSTDEHMVSRLWIEIAADGQARGSYIVDLKQTVGSDFDTGDIEVGPPVEADRSAPMRAPSITMPFQPKRLSTSARSSARAVAGFAPVRASQF